MAILMRGGGYLDFDPSKLRPREWAVVLQGDPSARDGKAVYICFAAGNVKRISTYEDMKDDLITATDDVIEQYVQVFGEIKTEVERLRSETLGYKNAAQEKATEAANSAQTASEKSQAASVSATNAANSADLSDIHSKMSESYAVGTNGEIRGNDETDNSKYYKEECQRLYQNIEQLISSVTTGGLIPAGTVRFIELPDVPNIGYMYNISDDFVTDDRFEEGEGKYYSSGTNVYWTANAKWDVLTGVAVLGVKGESEALYQTGYVVITKESIGLDKVENKTSREILDGLTATDVTNALGYIPGSEDGGVTGVKGGNETEYRKGNVNITKENIGLGSVENKSSEDIRAEITAENIENALGYVPGSGSGNVTGVKGEAEETYRSGNVNIAKSDIGLGNVDNTSDADKPISTAQREEFNKKVNKTDIMQGSTTTTPGKAGLVPAPGTGNPDAVLKSNGTWAEGTYRSLGEVSASGWYRIFSKTTSAVAGSGDAFMLTVSRGYSNNPPENFRVVCSTKYNSVQWCWHTLSSMVTSSKFVDKVRAAKKGNLLYIEVHYTASVRNTISFEMLYNSGFGTFSQEPRQALNFEPAEANETVVSEYTIPEKDDFETSKSLTRFTEIPEGANMHTYLTPGNYCCSSDAKAKTLKNCPLSGAFTMVVLFANGTSSYIKQIYKSYSGAQTVEVTVNDRGSWYSPNYFMYYQGTPPANKVWGTDANGNVGWIAPPLVQTVIEQPAVTETFKYYNHWTFKCLKYGRMVVLQIDISGEMVASSIEQKLITLPEGYRPYNNVIEVIGTQKGIPILTVIYQSGSFVISNQSQVLTGRYIGHTYVYFTS